MDFLEYFIIEVQQYKNDTFQVLFFPSPTEHFGYLVLVSFTSVFGGLCFFVLFVWFVILLFCHAFFLHSLYILASSLDSSPLYLV